MEANEGAQHVTGVTLFDWFDSGAKEVIGDSSYLNAINVFPIPDGDTGSNMSATLRAMVNIQAKKSAFNQTLEAISHNGMSGARGNSGIIFASYVNGLALEATPYEKVGVTEFAHIARNAVKHLYQAIENPVEGTMITVIHEWADALVKNSATVHTFNELLENAYKVAHAALERTKEQLEVLRKNNVVDSGAAGFLSFLRGINRHLSNGSSLDERPTTDFVAPSLVAEAPTFRYCTEALIEPAGFVTVEEIDAVASRIKDTMRPFGDSMVVTSQGGQTKLHIHTNEPEEVIAKAGEFGHLVSQKAEDMAMQAEMQAAQMQKIGILTDSAADIPEDFKLAHHIGTLNVGVLIGDEVFLDKQTINLKQVFQAMDVPGVYPTSSQAEPARVSALMQTMLEKFEQILVLSVSSKLSGTYQSFVRAKENLGAEKDRVTVIDTKLNSGAQGLLVMEAAKMVERGALLEEIAQSVEHMIPRTKIYVCLNTLEYAVRGGRVPDTIGKIGMALKLRPIMSLDAQGNGTAFAAAFSQRGLTKKIFKLVKKVVDKNGVYAYSITHGNNLPLAKAYAQQLTAVTGKKPEFIAEISAAIALHAGPGTVAVSLIEGSE